MAKASVGNGTKVKKLASACPNPGSGAHTSSNSSAGSYLTKAQIRAAIAAIGTSANSRLMRVARYRAFTAGIDAEDLLQEAILRALTSRSCPAGLKIEHFLMAVMRSIASSIIDKRRRNEPLLREAVDLLMSPSAPDDALKNAQRSDAWRQALDEIVLGSPEIERVVDGIGQGLCGKALAEFADTDQARLASARRTIKRRVNRVCVELLKLDEAA